MPVSKDKPDEERDPLYRYLERYSGRGKKLERLNALLKQLNLRTAAALDDIQFPPDKQKKN